ncbi:MAG TPA: tRNA lysidine(34) synthetase TilS [Terriglobales bacterium]
MYYVPVHELGKRICHSIRRNELLHPGDRVGVAVSGGPDSVALLRLLLELRKELGIVLSVVHLNHKLRGAESDADAEFVCGLAREHKLQLRSTTADVAEHASRAGISIETAARELRYQFFRELLGGSSDDKSLPDQDTGLSDPSSPVRIRGRLLDKIVTGHTLDDQAETVLMRIIRGTGMRGLRAIQPRLEVETEYGTAEIVRPLLEVRRQELQQYLRDIGQSWREDTSNRDPKFTRNRVRQVLLPLLEREFNPAITQRLAEFAEIARGEEDFWENEAAGWMGTGIHWVDSQPASPQLVQLTPAGSSPQPVSDPPMNALVDLAWLLSEHPAVQRRILRTVAGQAGFALDFRHVEQVLRFAAEEQTVGKELDLADGWKVQYGEDALEFIAPQSRPDQNVASDYEVPLRVPGEVTIPQIGSRLQAVQLEAGEMPSCDPEHLFDAALLEKELVVRNWRPGDRFWPAHSKAPKKIKELLQEKHVPQAQRHLWPVVLNGPEVIWVKGFPGRAQMRPGEGNPAVLIREIT